MAPVAEASKDESVSTLYSLYADEIFQYACYLLGNQADARDVVQETFLRVVRAWDDFRYEAGAKTWLWRIAKNCIVDTQRRRKRNREDTHADVAVFETVVAGSPVTSLELMEMVMNLPDFQRQVVTLRFIHDFSTEETASILGCTGSKVRNTLHKAVVRLRMELSPESVGKEANSRG